MRYNARQTSHSGWSLIKTIVFFLAIACAGWLLFQRTVQNQLSHKVQDRVDQLLAGTDINASIQHASFVDGQGLKLRNVSVGTNATGSSLSSLSSSTSVIEIYEAFVRSPVSLPQLVAGNMPIQSVEIRRARLNLMKDTTGTWNIESLIHALQKLKTSGETNVPVILRDCQIELVDLSDPDAHRQVRVSNLTLSVMPIDHQGHQLTQVSGQFSCSEVSDVHFTAWIDPANGTWKANLDASDLRLSRDSLLLLPASLASKVNGLHRLEGRVSVKGTLSGDTGLVHTPNIELMGQCKGIAVSDTRLPWVVEDTDFEFNVTNNGFRIQDASGKVGNGRFQGNYGQIGWSKRRQWQLNGQVHDYQHQPDRRLGIVAPGYCTKFCSDFQPRGTCDLDFDLNFDGQKLHRVINAQLKDMAFTFVGLPYQITNTAGIVKIVDHNCRFHVRAIEGEQPIDVKGTVSGMGEGATFTCDISVPGALPINEKMFKAIQKFPHLSRVISSFNPIGQVGGTARLQRTVANGPVDKQIDTHLKNVDIRHDSFPYPIRNITGQIQSRNEKHRFVNLRGHNGDCAVTAEGTWNPRDGLGASLVCSSMPLDDQLRVALKPSLREIWHGFHPRGTIERMFTELRMPIGQRECSVTIEAHLPKRNQIADNGSVSIQPTWFPYEIRDLTGVIKIGDGRVSLADIEGHHGRSWLKCNGDGQYSAEDWFVRLNDMLVLSLSVDDDLIDAVPSSLAPQVRDLQYEGKVNARGEMTLAGRYRKAGQTPVQPLNRFAPAANGLNSSAFSLAWNVQLDMTGARMLVGVPIENVFGAVKLVGQYDGQLAECRGDLDIDSMTIYGNQLTAVKGPIWLDNDRAAAGLFAEKTPDPKSQASPLQRKPPQSLVGTLYDGKVHLDAQISSGELGEFYVQSTLEEAKLESICREACPTIEDITGRTFAAFRLVGNSTGTHTYRGDGQVQLRDATIYELPPVLALLKNLRLGRSDRSAFDSSNVNFTISGETIELNRIEMLGDAISLIGNGQLSTDRKIDLNFYSIVGRNRFHIPVVSQMIHAGSQQALWIHVNGTIDDPKMTRTVLPQLNDSLRQLFQSNPATGPQRYADQGFYDPSGRRTLRQPTGLGRTPTTLSR